MLSRVDQVAQLCSHIRELSRPDDIDRVQRELKSILSSEQFRTSQRSCAFLRYVVQKALNGNFDSLKERIVGVELFGRDTSFDTDHDSVVRVAANDVRKRLREYYRERPPSGVRISIPSGVYIPEIEISPEELPRPHFEHGYPSKDLTYRWKWNAALLLLAALGISWATALEIHSHRYPSGSPALSMVLPWRNLLKGGREINVVVADANLVVKKVRSGQDVPVETYANHSVDYAGNLSGPFGAFLNEIPLTTVSDAMLAARIAALAAQAGNGARVRYCSRFDVSELKGDEPLVLFGSPMSNPWVELLYNQLNFRVVHRFDSGMDVCINRQPKPGELPVYVPSRIHNGFSEGYAIVALEPNLAARAPVLIIAGTSTEGTEAAGELVTNFNRLSDTLRKLGIDKAAAIQHLELLVKTSYVSAASTTSEVVAYRAQ